MEFLMSVGRNGTQACSAHMIERLAMEVEAQIRGTSDKPIYVISSGKLDTLEAKAQVLQYFHSQGLTAMNLAYDSGLNADTGQEGSMRKIERTSEVFKRLWKEHGVNMRIVVITHANIIPEIIEGMGAHLSKSPPDHGVITVVDGNAKKVFDAGE